MDPYILKKLFSFFYLHKGGEIWKNFPVAAAIHVAHRLPRMTASRLLFQLKLAPNYAWFVTIQNSQFSIHIRYILFI